MLNYGDSTKFVGRKHSLNCKVKYEASNIWIQVMEIFP